MIVQIVTLSDQYPSTVVKSSSPDRVVGFHLTVTLKVSKPLKQLHNSFKIALQTSSQ